MRAIMQDCGQLDPSLTCLLCPCLASPCSSTLQVPGNPGVVEYYISYMTRLWELCGRRVEVIVRLSLSTPPFRAP